MFTSWKFWVVVALAVVLGARYKASVVKLPVVGSFAA